MLTDNNPVINRQSTITTTDANGNQTTTIAAGFSANLNPNADMITITLSCGNKATLEDAKNNAATQADTQAFLQLLAQTAAAAGMTYFFAAPTQG